MPHRWDEIDRLSASERDSALELLIRELLLDRTQTFDGRTLAAFVDGWTSLLDLLGRVDLILPGAPPQLREALTELVGRIRAAQLAALADEDLP